MPKFGLVVGVVLFAVLAVPAAAQPAPDSLSITALQRNEQRLTVSATILDSANNPVQGIAAGALSAQVDGQAAPIVQVTSAVDAALPLGLVLAVDTSGSMQGQAIESARSALAPLANALPASDQATLITFAQEVTVVVPATNDRAALAAAIAALPANGNTALYAGVATAAAAATELAQPRKAIVLLSDGEDFGNASAGVTREQALQAGAAAGAAIFVIGLGNEIDQSFLTALARDSGGQYFAAATPAELAQLYSRISERLRQQYTVTIDLPAGLPGGDHTVTLAAGGAAGRANFATPSAGLAPIPAITGVPGTLSVPVTVRLAEVPAGTSVRFEVDGSPMQAQNDGRSVRLDPYRLAPGSRMLTARDASGAVLASAPFIVPPLAPKLLQPTTLPNLAPGDLVRLTLQSQPGEATAIYLVDGVEAERDSAEPFEFVLPADGGKGEHELTVRLTAAGGETTHAFPFTIEGSDGGSNLPLFVALGLVGLVVAGGGVYAGRLGLARYRERSPAPVALDLPELTAWAQGGRSDVIPARPAGAAGASERLPASTVWGRLTVLEGPDAGKSFVLTQDRELLGRGKFCTVRLKDKALEEAHVVLTREGTLAASSGRARVEVAGEAVRTAPLASGLEFRAGASLVRIALGP